MHSLGWRLVILFLFGLLFCTQFERKSLKLQREKSKVCEKSLFNILGQVDIGTSTGSTKTFQVFPYAWMQCQSKLMKMKYCRNADAAVLFRTENTALLHGLLKRCSRLPGHGYSRAAQSRPGPLQRKPK